jgi:hypothetical protein
MVSSRGIDSGAERRSVRGCAVINEIMCDDVQGSTSALGTGSVQCSALLIIEQCAESSACGAEMVATQRQRLATVPVGKESEVPNLYEPCRQHMEHEASNELRCFESHRAAAVVVARVAPAKPHRAVFEVDESAVRDGDTVGIAGQILQHMVWTTEGRLGVDYPLSTSQASEQRVEGARRRKCSQLAGDPPACVGVDVSWTPPRVPNTLSKCHRCIPSRASGLVQIANALKNDSQMAIESAMRERG